MFRYLALAWNVDATQQCAAAQLLIDRLTARPKPWGRIEQSKGLCVLHRNFRQGSLDVQALPDQRGVLIGASFERLNDVTDDSAAPRFRPTVQQSEQIIASRGRWLVEHTWGNYVALLRDPAANRTWVLKDPTGSLPCFVTSFHGVQVIFGDIATLVSTQLFKFTINERYLRDRVLHGGVLDQRALDEVQTIYRGECVELGGTAQPRVFHWQPLHFVETSTAIEDPAFAARAMRATVRSCTRTLCSDHESILHRLSGGLDSSIIAACLADAPTPPRLTCYTYFTPGGRSDERPWARLAASRHRLQHQEHSVTADQIPLPKVMSLPPLVEPTASLGYLLRSSLEHQIAREHRATAVFCGDGGDSGFCGDTFAYAASEYLHRHGLRPHAFRLAARVAGLTEESTWTVMMKSLRRWRRGAGMEHQRRTVMSVSTLVDEALRASYADVSSFPHPWLAHLQTVPWSLVRRLGTLLATPEFYNVASGIDPPEVLAPLYSQPAMELFLRIPVDVHFQDGRERGLARQAFAHDVPAEIIRRHWKDRAPGIADRLVERHRGLLRELLLDGVLVEAQLLNRKAVEEALSERVSKSAIHPGELLRHLDVEVWARSWRSCALDARRRATA
ncbi:asparagine synthase C-terminal domain-containing protein [Steroidobacter cummioxidans]|uniref:asparagine synthase-related protein n=1 Tax=Steroidobacter cummioxidans TaxID=1803913 RepID=UPI00137B6823|nr:asparagine synthase C-terminal domain-containing protein [Steroidobacter cummioxidans]